MIPAHLLSIGTRTLEPAMPRSTQRAAHPATPAAPALALATQFVDAVESTSRQALRRCMQDAELVRDETREASDLGEIGAVQAAWAAEAWGRALQAWSSVACAAFDAQSAWWRNAEGLMHNALQPWLPEAQHPLAIEPLLEPPSDTSPRGGWRGAPPMRGTRSATSG
jgi:hypothetical protein